MFNIGFSEILVIALVSIIVLDKDKMPAFINFVKNMYRYFIIANSRARKLLKDTGIEDLYKEYRVEKTNYIIGEDGRFYPTYNIGNISKSDDDSGKDSGSR